MKRLLFLLLVWDFHGTTYAQTKLPKYAVADVLNDLDYLYNTLQVSAYNLFVTTSKTSFDRAYKKINTSLEGKDSLNKLETIKLFQRFVAMAQLAHCTLDPPFYDVYENYKSNGGTLFPFAVRINGNRVFIKYNYSSDTSIVSGDEILTINNKPVSNYLKDMYTILSGEDDYFKSTLIDIYTFPKMMWEVFGRSDNYEITIKKKGHLKVVKLKAIATTEFDKVNKGITEILHFERSFRFLNDETAYFHPGIFLNTGAQSTSDHASFDKGEFIQFLDSSFRQIHLRKSKFLIVDLRGNPGGDDSYSNPMVAYFATKPFWYCSRFSIKTSELTKKFWKDVTDTTISTIKGAILSHKDGEIFDVPLPTYQPRTDSLRFTGKVYVLINRYSYSNAATTPAMIQDYGFGKIVGEATADCPTLYAAIHDFKLPHTQLAVSYPKAFMVRPNGNTEFKGVQPDYKIDADDTTKEDDVLQKTLQIIKDNK